MSQIDCLITTLGTDGDVFPYIGLGTRLVERGHRVTLLTSGHYRQHALAGGMEFEELLAAEDVDALLEHPDFWHPVKGPVIASRFGRMQLDQQFGRLARRAETANVMVASPAVLAARTLQEQTGVPLATGALQPWMIKSLSAPPVMPGGMSLPAWFPRPLGRLYWRAVDAVGDVLISHDLNRARAKRQMPPIKRLFEWWLSPELILGMFPEWYGNPQPDWPPQLRMVGFPAFDGQNGLELSDTIQQFLDAGPPPVAFTFGTGMMHAAEQFRAVVQACERLHIRGILLTRHTPQVPEVLPPTVCHREFEPFGRLLPRCAVVVHHGGIGTTAQSFAAGVPQLIVPHGYDQFDNAVRVRRLGAGTSLSRQRRDCEPLAAALQSLMQPAVRERCRQLQKEARQTDALTSAARLVEDLAERPSNLTQGSSAANPTR